MKPTGTPVTGAIGEVAVSGQFGGSIRLVVLLKANMTRRPPKLQIVKLRLKGAQGVLCTLRQGVGTLAPLGILKSRLGIGNNGYASEGDKGYKRFDSLAG